VLLSPRGDLALDGAEAESRTLEWDVDLTGASTATSADAGALTVIGFDEF
jgi:hypothetical protein